MVTKLSNSQKGRSADYLSLSTVCNASVDNELAIVTAFRFSSLLLKFVWGHIYIYAHLTILARWYYRLSRYHITRCRKQYTKFEGKTSLRLRSHERHLNLALTGFSHELLGKNRMRYIGNALYIADIWQIFHRGRQGLIRITKSLSWLLMASAPWYRHRSSCFNP